MKIFKLLALCTLLALLLVPVAVFAQEQAPERNNVVEFGFRGVTGDVYGRTNAGAVPFSNNFRPDLVNSPLNTYYDYRNSFYIPKFSSRIDNLFGSTHYLSVQSSSNGFAFEGGGTLSRDMSALATIGQYGHYKLQFRFDETPHLFSGTTRSLFTPGGNGAWNINSALQSSIFNSICGGLTSTGACKVTSTGAALVALNASTLSSAVAGTLTGAPGAQFMSQQESRKAGTASLSWNITPDISIASLFSREHQLGTRPIGMVFGASSGGYVAEVPESIDYYTTNFGVSTEFGKKHWDALLGYQTQFFHDNTPNMLVMSPFSNTFNQVVYNSSSDAWSSTMGPASGRMDNYPDNNYLQFVTEGALELGKRVHLMANVTPGWMHQTASFQPLTTNTFFSSAPPAGYPAFLPADNLGGQVDTLAMNYTAIFKATKDLSFAAKYQHYGYDNNTPDLLLRPVVGDTLFLTSGSFHGSSAGCYDPVAGPSSMDKFSKSYTYYCPAEQTSFTSKLLDLGGTWFFSKKNSMKFGYQRGWMDRTNREVAETIENTLYAAVDTHLHKNVVFRLSARRQDRMPQGGLEAYEADTSNLYSRMLDQSTRIRNRGDASLQWDATQKLSLSGFWGTMQDNFNQRSSVNSLVALGDTTYSPLKIAGSTTNPTYGPYYAYGLLNNIARNYGFDANYALTSNVTLFAEYGREKNTGLVIQGRGLNDPTTCVPTGSGFVYPSGCDPINDLKTAMKDSVNSYYGGADITAKKLDLSLYYSLSAAQAFTDTDGVNCQITGNPTSYCFNRFKNWSLDTAANPAVTFSYPQNVNRVHEVGAIVRFKLPGSFVPKFQYIYRQYDNKDWQTGVMNPFSFVGTTIDPSGTSAMQKLLFLGADQPSFRAHMITATMEYHF